MKKPILRAVGLATTVITLGTLSCGCTDKPRKDFDLTIVVSEPLQDIRTDRLAEPVINLCLPITECPDFTLIARPVLCRIGADEPAQSSLAAQISPGTAGNRDNVKFIERAIRKHLSSMQLGEAFTRGDNTHHALSSHVSSFLHSSARHAIPIFVTSKTPGEAFKDVIVVGSTDSARSLIATQLCKKKSSAFVVFLNPPIEDLNEDPSTSQEDVRSTLKTLAEENKAASQLTDPLERKSRLEFVKHEIEIRADSADYRFTYELVKNSIYGKEHLEAFQHLRKAAEIAIGAGQAPYLLDRITGDKDTDLWKLSHGHSDQWDPILEALEHNDKNELTGAAHETHKH